MDLQDRETYEEELAALLLLLIMSQGSSFWQGAVPSPASVWNLIRSSRIPGVVSRLSSQAAQEALRNIRVDGLPPELNARMPVVSQKFTQRIAERITRKHQEWQRQRRLAILEGKRPPGVKQLYDEIARRSDAVTGTTEVVSESQILAAEFAKKFMGIGAKRIWRLDPRSNSCETCISLNGKDESVWSRQFPKGPPAHPRCACEVELVRTLSN